MSRALLAELDAVPLDLLGHARRHLGALEDDEHVVEDDRALELERREPGEALVESRAVGLERSERLIRPRQRVRDLPELVAKVADEDRHRLALLRDRDDQRVRLLGDALGGAVPRAGLARGDRGVGHQLDVRVHELLPVRGDHDGAVHLGQLVEELGRERQVEAHAAREEERQLVRVADDDERPVLGADDVVDPRAQRRSRRHLLERREESLILPRVRSHRAPQ